MSRISKEQIKKLHGMGNGGMKRNSCFGTINYQAVEAMETI